MIILHQDNRIRTLCFSDDSGGEPRINGAILIPIRFSEGRPDKYNMTKRP